VEAQQGEARQWEFQQGMEEGHKKFVGLGEVEAQ
jgi:hypothetical protein